MTLCFTDCETTGLLHDDEIWEFASRRREPDGSYEDLHLYINHDVTKAQRLPTPFFKDWKSRYPSGSHQWKQRVDQKVAALQIQEFTLGAHLVGANPAFDAEKLAILLRRNGLEPKWHYHLLDIEAVIVGFLAGRGETPKWPWKSEELSRRVGVDPSKYGRHTAAGDVTWVEAQWDAVIGEVIPSA